MFLFDNLSSHINMFSLGAKMLRHIRDVLNEDVCRPFLFFFLSSSLIVDPSNQSCLLIIDCIVLPGVASAEGQDLAESLSKMDTKVYQPVPSPEFIPIDFGDASRLQHLLNVTLTALCNCEKFILFWLIFLPPECCIPHPSAPERTLPQLQEVVELGGFKIKKVHATRWVL